MATENEAHRAREQASESLRQLGAHAIAVDKCKLNNRSTPTFCVIAFFEQRPTNIPETLPATLRNKTVEVPLVVRVAGKFKPE